MGDDISDILFGADPDDLVLGKEPDWTKPARVLAIILIIGLLGNLFFSALIEEYRLQALMQETRSMSLNGIQCAVEEIQNIGEDDMSYLVDSSGLLTDTYNEYLDNLASLAITTRDSDLMNVVNILKNGDSNGERYTPLSFNLTYLDKTKLKNLIDRNLTEIFTAVNSTEFNEGDTSAGSIFEELIMGSERTEYVGCDVEIQGMRVIDITNVDLCPDDSKSLYRAVYGTENQNASKLDGMGLTERHYLIVYQVKYTVTWIPYTRTLAFQNLSGAKKNADGFSALPEIKDEYTELYYVTN